jgi:lysophospholipase L1-like esterase
MQTITALDAKLGINDSWAGSTVTNTITGNSGDLGEKAAMASLTRIRNLGANGTPDVILFYGGTNDIGRLLPLGSFDPATAPTEVDLTTTKWTTVADAYVDAIMRLQYHYPEAEILAMLPTYTTSYYTNAKLAQYNSMFSAICEHYGIPYIDLRDCGISTADLPDGIHPDASGMDYITGAVLDMLLNDVEMEAGENVVYSVTHNLNDAESSLGYYKGVTHGNSFVTTITGENVTVSVTMGGVDITDTAYANGVITVPAVTGDLVITIRGQFSAGGHLQQLPENLCSGINLWTVLEHDDMYYTSAGWGYHTRDQVRSVTFPVQSGDKIYATSFGEGSDNGSIQGNGSRTNGIRVTFFLADGKVKSMAPNEVYSEFAANGYLTAPEGAIAVCIPMWTPDDSNKLHILNAEHVYESGRCGCGATQPGPVITQQPKDVSAERFAEAAVSVVAEGDGLTYAWYYRCAGETAFRASACAGDTFSTVMSGDLHGCEVYCVITDTAGNSVTSGTAVLTLTGEAPEMPPVRIPGDINGDGEVNNKDLVRLFQYLSGWAVEIY